MPVCDWARCWREAQTFIPGTPLAYCSSHALLGLGTWPTRRFRELETQVKDSRSYERLIRGGTAA
jgi:hypothetical protein